MSPALLLVFLHDVPLNQEVSFHMYMFYSYNATSQHGILMSESLSVEMILPQIQDHHS